MCFRPAESTIVPVCPTCGEKVPIVGGVVLKKCPHCKGDMPNNSVAAAAPGTAGAPKAPSAPKTPPTGSLSQK